MGFVKFSLFVKSTVYNTIYVLTYLLLLVGGEWFGPHWYARPVVAPICGENPTQTHKYITNTDWSGNTVQVSKTWLPDNYWFGLIST